MASVIGGTVQLFGNLGRRLDPLAIPPHFHKRNNPTADPPLPKRRHAGRLAKHLNHSCDLPVNMDLSPRPNQLRLHKRRKRGPFLTACNRYPPTGKKFNLSAPLRGATKISPPRLHQKSARKSHQNPAIETPAARNIAKMVQHDDKTRPAKNNPPSASKQNPPRQRQTSKSPPQKIHVKRHVPVFILHDLGKYCPQPGFIRAVPQCAKKKLRNHLRRQKNQQLLLQPKEPPQKHKRTMAPVPPQQRRMKRIKNFRLHPRMLLLFLHE